MNTLMLQRILTEPVWLERMTPEDHRVDAPAPCHRQGADLGSEDLAFGPGHSGVADHAATHCSKSIRRLSRTLKDLLLILDRITAVGAGFRSLTEVIDTTVLAGRMMMQMLGVFAGYEREMVKERTQADLKTARAQGRHGGRRPKFTQAQRAEVLSMSAAGRPAAEVARSFQVHRATISRLNATSVQTEAV